MSLVGIGALYRRAPETARLSRVLTAVLAGIEFGPR